MTKGEQMSAEYKQNYVDSLRKELLDVVAKDLSPMAQEFGYAEHPLEQKIQWRPCVLILGNYSSGKSTFINELIGQDVQLTGQAPTDDSFTVISYDADASEIEERDGKALLGGTEFPFASLKRFGQRFASHFKLKTCSAPILQGLALIDTPGMLDSISERDRGYNYQEVIGELAEIADLILVMFDPHKAGTIRETYESLRKTLPKATYEDRVIFVLNRVDECSNLQDLLRVYGTLCWNLSQMTGRKDIPHIRLTWSEATPDKASEDFLSLLENQRNELKEQIEKAPRHRLDHLVTFIEEHSARLHFFSQTLIKYSQQKRLVQIKTLIASFAVGWLLLGAVIYAGGILDGNLSPMWQFGITLVAGSCIGTLLFGFLKPLTFSVFYNGTLNNMDGLVHLRSEMDKDTWESIRRKVEQYLKESAGKFSFKKVRNHLKTAKKLQFKKSKDLRKALEEMPKA